MADDTDYLELPVPDDKPKPKYNYYERRADIAERIRQQGHPTGFNYAAIGREFDVTRETIRSDFEILREYFKNNLGRDAKMTADLAYQRIIREQMADGDLEAARRALDSWTHWLFETGEERRAPKRVDADVTNREADGESESYEILGDDDEISVENIGVTDSTGEADTDDTAEDAVDPEQSALPEGAGQADRGDPGDDLGNGD